MKGRYEKELSVLTDIADHVGKESRKLMLRIDRRVVNETPVDTGAAKRNWLAGVNQSPNTVIIVDGTDNTSIAALQAIEQGAVTISNAKGFDTIYINNNLPYIKRLNEGWSQQSPARYVDKIIEQEVAR